MVRKGENRTTSSATPRVDTVSLATLELRISLLLSIKIQFLIWEKFEKHQFEELMFCKELIGRSKKKKEVEGKIGNSRCETTNKTEIEDVVSEKNYFDKR